MKREKDLIYRIADPDNIRLAYLKARKGKEYKPEVIEFTQNLGENVKALHFGFLNNELEIGNYNYFTIYDPKERVICAAAFTERIMQHSIMNICHDNFDRYQIFDSYACRKDKGTYAAIERAKYYTRNYKWYLKLDIKKYFNSIDHKVLFELIEKRIKDEDLLLIFYKIIESYETDTGKGIPIGNLTSQYFANHYLGQADHLILEKIGIDGYVRYMDDMVLWSNDKEELIKKGREFIKWIEDNLLLKLNPIILNKSNLGLSFLGYKIHPNYMKLTQTSKRRFIKKFLLYEDKLNREEWSQKEYQNHILPLLSFVQKADTYNLRKALL